MNIKKRIIPIVLFFALIASSIAVGQWAVKAASDTTGPVLKSMSSGSGSANGGGTINTFITATDDISGVNHAVIWYISPSGIARNTVTLYPNSSGSLTGSFIVNQYSEASKWMVDYVELYDNAGNKSVVYNSEVNTFGYLKDLSLGDYYVDSVLVDNDQPVFQGISVDKKSTGPNSSVNLTVKASDGTSHINYAYVHYISPNGFVKDCYLYPNATGVLKDSIEVNQYDEAGRWTVDYIEICDNAGNYIAIVNSELYNDPELPLMNLGAGDFDVIGTSIDATAPAFQGISVDKSKLVQDGEVNLTLKGTDALSGIDSAMIMYTSPSGADSNLEILYPDSNGNLKTTIATTFNYKEIGKWKVSFIVLFDKAGNWTEVYNTETNTDTSLNLMDLSQGDFEFYVMKYQSEPTGLTGIQTTIHEGTDGKITGTTTGMEYQLLEDTVCIPVNGTEITGLAAGSYYVRYAAKEEYYASSYTRVEVKGPVWDVNNGTLIKYNGAGGDVVIPDNLGITSIGPNAFVSCSSLTSVVIPSSVTSIGKNAFSYCRNLTNVNIPDGVTTLSDYIFEDCSALKTIAIPSSVTSIGQCAFVNCKGLTGVALPQGLISIGSSAFLGCSGLTSMAIPSGVTILNDGMFYGCGALESVTLPEGLTSIGNLSFHECASLTNILIPSTVTSIGSSAFSWCKNLENVNIPEGITKIDMETFSYCGNLTSITIPSSVTRIFNYAFFCCDKLATVNAYPVVAPTAVTNGLGIPSTAILCIPSGATGYDVAPWTQFQQKVINYTVSYDINGGNGTTPIAVTSPSGSIITTPLKGDLSKSGYNFTGWNTSSSGSGGTHYDTGASYSIGSGNAILYAEWTPVKLTDIKVTAPPAKIQYVVGQSIDLTGLVVTGSYDDGTTAPVTVNATNISGFSSSTPVSGQKITVTVSGKTATFTVNVAANIDQEAPTGLYVVAPTTYGGSDGKITGTKASMEYKLLTETIYKAVTGTEITGLKAGTYNVRYAAKTGYNAGADAVVVVTNEPIGNLAAGKVPTSSYSVANISRLTDGNKDTKIYYGTTTGKQWVQLDLGATYNLNDIKLWHYFADPRKYHDVIVQLSNDSTFATNVTTVFNNDADNTAGLGLGAGKDLEYAETTTGKDISFGAVDARYVRFYSNGSTGNAWNHYVEIEVFGTEGVAAIHPISVSLNKTIDTIAVGSTDKLAPIFTPADTTNKNVTWSSSDEAVASVSPDGTVTGLKNGTATVTVTTEDGGYTAACLVTVGNLAAGKLPASSYSVANISRLTDGNKDAKTYYGTTTGKQWVQLDLGASYILNDIKLWHYFADPRKYHDVIVQISNDPNFKTNVTTVFNNDMDNTAGLGLVAGTDTEYAETSAGKDIPVASVNARYVRLYSNGSTANAWNHYVEVEVYGTEGIAAIHPISVSLNKTIDTIAIGSTEKLTPIFTPADTTNKNVTWSSSDEAVASVSTDGTVTGLKNGTATVTVTTEDGGYTAACLVTVGNLAAGKLPTSSYSVANISRLTDGNKDAKTYYGTTTGKQWVQLDLGASYILNDIKLWHYFADPRKYHDVIVQISNDPNFKTNVTTVFNNDMDNTAGLGLGAGTDTEYAETSAGKDIPVASVNARYVRFYSNGSTANAYNHYVEVEVYGSSD